jgi:hypothetical protein
MAANTSTSFGLADVHDDRLEVSSLVGSTTDGFCKLFRCVQHRFRATHGMRFHSSFRQRRPHHRVGMVRLVTLHGLPSQKFVRVGVRIPSGELAHVPFIDTPRLRNNTLFRRSDR